jgi:hypothetical protein
MTKQQQKINEREEAIQELKSLIKKGDTVYTILTHVSSNGMSRRFKVLVLEDSVFMPPDNKKIKDISHLVAQALEYRHSKTGYEVVVGGAGMDMAYHLVYTLSQALGYRTLNGKPDTDTNCYGLNHKHL